MQKPYYSFLIVLIVLVSGCDDSPTGPLSVTSKIAERATDMSVSQRSLEATLYFRYSANGLANSAQITRKNEPVLYTAIPGREGNVYTVNSNTYIWTGGQLETYVLPGKRWEVEYDGDYPSTVTYINNRTEQIVAIYELEFFGENIRSLEVYNAEKEFQSGYYWKSYDSNENVFAGDWWFWHVQGMRDPNDVYSDLFPVGFFMKNNPRTFERITADDPENSYQIELGYVYDDRNRTLEQDFNEASISTVHRFEYNVENQ
jgi:hypothetical protein